MVNLTKSPTVGSQFTTAKSKVTGEVKEIVKNQNGSMRVRLDVAGQERWTTVKQFTAPDLSMSRLNYSPNLVWAEYDSRKWKEAGR